MAHPTRINLSPTTPKKGRPRAYKPLGFVTSGGGSWYFAPIAVADAEYHDNLPRFAINAPLGKALTALAANPDRSYEEVGRAAGFQPDSEGNYSAPVSRAIKAMARKADKMLSGAEVRGAKTAKVTSRGKAKAQAQDQAA